MNRRNFIKKLGLGLSVTGLAATGCKKSSSLSLSGTDSDREVPTDKMTYRITPSTGDKVSLLGYGCMRWPLMPDPNGKEGAEIIDQEEGKEPVEILLGTVINIPANVKHWHGAAKASWFSHLAFSVPGENESTEWLEPVDDEYYYNIQ